MERPHRESGRGADVDPAGRRSNSTAEHPKAQPARLRRTVFRKICVEPFEGGWRARIVGYDARFWNGATSGTFASRHLALQAAMAASRECGLPVVAIETLSSPDGPQAA